MSLNCLMCQMSRTDSGKAEADDNNKFGACLGGRVDRTWSGNLAAWTSYEILRSGSNLEPIAKKVIKKPSNLVTRSGPTGVTAPAEDPFGGQISPRLVRSSGMRRDWSFEDLRRRVK